MYLASMLVALALAAPPAPVPEVRLQVHAGLGGVARAGRWMPVRVDIENGGGELTGELVIEWGDARLHRRLTLAPASRLDLELYLRTIDVRDLVTVRALVDGETIAAADAPLRIAGTDESIRLCVTSIDGGADSECTATVGPATLPRSMRGYDSVDAVTWRAGPESILAADQRAALRRWRAYRALEDADLLSRAPRAAGDPAAAKRPPTPVLAAAAVGVVLLLAVGVVWRLPPRRAALNYAVSGAALLAATAATAFAGRIGLGAAVVLRHATDVRQVGDGSIVTLRGRIVYPAFDTYAVRATIADGTLLPAFGASSEQWFDDDGLPVSGGTHGQRDSDDITFEGVTDYHPFRVTAADDSFRIANVSNQPLAACRLGDGASPMALASIAPGDEVRVRAADAAREPWFTCRAAVSPVAFVDPRFDVRADGLVMVSVPLVATGGGDDR